MWPSSSRIHLRPWTLLMLGLLSTASLSLTVPQRRQRRLAFCHPPTALRAITIRRFRSSDADAIAWLFHDTVRTVNRRDYSPSQVQAWAPNNVHFKDWANIGANRWRVVAELSSLSNNPTTDEPSCLVGFAELEEDTGHLDCLYCHYKYQRRGIGKQLYQALEGRGEALQLPQLSVDASQTARPFFESMGFTVVQSQTVSCRGETFCNFHMNKELTQDG